MPGVWGGHGAKKKKRGKNRGANTTPFLPPRPRPLLALADHRAQSLQVAGDLGAAEAELRQAGVRQHGQVPLNLCVPRDKAEKEARASHVAMEPVKKAALSKGN